MGVEARHAVDNDDQCAMVHMRMVGAATLVRRFSAPVGDLIDAQGGVRDCDDAEECSDPHNRRREASAARRASIQASNRFQVDFRTVKLLG